MAHDCMESLNDSSEASGICFWEPQKGNWPGSESTNAAAECAAVQARGKPMADNGLPNSLALQFADFRCWIAVFLSQRPQYVGYLTGS